MTPSIVLSPDQRQDLLDRYRKDPDPEIRFRAHILLLLADGHTWATVAMLLFCSSRTIDRWVKRFHQDGIEGLTGKKRGRPFRFGLGWVALVVAWVTQKTPRDFGFLRSRWCCATVVLLLRERHDLTVSRETVRRWLQRSQVVYRRPRPVVGPTDPERQKKLVALRKLVAELPADETVVWQDEVEIHSNPKIGRMWMFKGQQATVTTPGTNRKRHLSGSIHWRTGQVFLTEAAPKQGRNAALFLQHLDDLRRKLRRYRKIHVICDNAKFHTSLEVIEYLWKWEGRIEVHLLPLYAPDLNPIERVWWLLHEHITRNHRCKNLEELLELVFAWLEAESPFKVEDKDYQVEEAA
jgi:putative transposase